jgi:hypothetical protein
LAQLVRQEALLQLQLPRPLQAAAPAAPVRRLMMATAATLPISLLVTRFT